MKTKLLFPIVLVCQMMFGQKDSLGIDYMRSSLATFFVDNGKLEQDAIVKDAFLTKFAPDKYNPHELSDRIISNSSNLKKKELIDHLSNYFKKNQTAKQLVAKWFNRSKKGGFSTDLLMKRGLYNAQELDKQIAKSTVSGII
jgi:hypothetical protein